MTKKRTRARNNVQDTTLKNQRVTRREINGIARRLKLLERRLTQLIEGLKE